MKARKSRMTQWRAYQWGGTCAVLDANENAPFGSVGGVDNRHQLKAPYFVPTKFQTSFMSGYRAECARRYGADWKTCKFGWRAILTLKKREP